MPRLMPTSDDQVFNIPGPGNFQFSGQRIEKLGATEYTLVSIVVDVSGSVQGFKNDLQKCIQTIVDACKNSPRVDNLMIRVITFNHNIDEVHGFKELKDININDYNNLNPDGYTKLFDATYNAIGATLSYSKTLIEQDFIVNGAVYIITDGMDNQSKITRKQIATKITESRSNEIIESLITILIGLHDPQTSWEKDVKESLEKFQRDALIDQFVDVGSATPRKLAKLANWVSQSVSSTSQALGKGASTPPPSITF